MRRSEDLEDLEALGSGCAIMLRWMSMLATMFISFGSPRARMAVHLMCPLAAEGACTRTAMRAILHSPTSCFEFSFGLSALAASL